MAIQGKAPANENVTVYRHSQAKRKNNPPAGLAPQGKVAEKPVLRYAYNPHLSPALRFDATGASDTLPELLQIARQRPLTADEAATLAEALRNREPWLEWAGKRERKYFDVDPVALHIHERVSAQAILKVATRKDVQRDLFADPELDYREAVRFYEHDVAWANRLILGDSLAVMASLAHREDLAGKVQMIYVDPPYGIKFASNFQSQVGKRDVKDKPEDLTRELETVKAYRDTWTLGVHSYLAYLRDRLCLAKELLADTGSIFVQIGDDNLHLVRNLLDDVFGASNFVGIISFRTKIPLRANLLAGVADYILWYARDKNQVKYRKLYDEQNPDDSGLYTYREYASGERRGRRSEEEGAGQDVGKPFASLDLSSSGATTSCMFAFQWAGRSFSPTRGKSWKTNEEGMRRLARAERLFAAGTALRYVLYHADYPVAELTNLWMDTLGAGGKLFVVQTSTSAVQRCMLMTTDPGDLVLDPTCGSGTTAYVAEQWGRRWITIDTSRVALAIARQRILTAKFDYYKLKDAAKGVSGNFRHKTVPHITLKSIAQNAGLDPIFAKHAPILEAALSQLNGALESVDGVTRTMLAAKLVAKQKKQGRGAITEADRRRWLLPREPWREWEVPFDTDPAWPESIQRALTAYRDAWRAKMVEVNDCIAAGAEPEELVDQPEVERGVVRVAGPFTVEAVQPAEERLETEPAFEGPDDELETFAGDSSPEMEPANAEAYLDRMLRLLKNDGVRFPDNRVMTFSSLEPLTGGLLHAEGEWAADGGETRRVAVSFGPQYGPIAASQVEECLWSASRRGYDDLVFAGFSFDAAAQAAIQEDPNPRVRCHLANIRPDVNMVGLLKDTPNSQLFTVFGLPRTRVERNSEGDWVATMEGVDVYNPVDNSLVSTGATR